MEECTGEGADIPGEFEFSEEHLSPASSVEDSKVDEMQEIQARKAKALRKWKRWCAVPLALTDMILEKRKTAVEDHLRSLFVAQKREGTVFICFDLLFHCQQYVSCRAKSTLRDAF